jgi:MFS family permease
MNHTGRSGRKAIGPHDGTRRVLGVGAYHAFFGAVVGLVGARQGGLGMVLDAAWHIGLSSAAVLGVLGAVVSAVVSPGGWARKVRATAAVAGALALGGFLFGASVGALFGGLEALLALVTGGWEGSPQSACVGGGIGGLLGMAAAWRASRAKWMTEDEWRGATRSRSGVVVARPRPVSTVGSHLCVHPR